MIEMQMRNVFPEGGVKLCKFCRENLEALHKGGPGMLAVHLHEKELAKR
jgi:hypothetical protein